MAGDHGALKHDPAIERWAAMRDDVYRHFRFTRRNTPKVVFWGLAVPAGVIYLAFLQDAKWDWRGKLKGQSLLRNQPEPSSPPAEE